MQVYIYHSLSVLITLIHVFRVVPRRLKHQGWTTLPGSGTEIT